MHPTRRGYLKHKAREDAKPVNQALWTERTEPTQAIESVETLFLKSLADNLGATNPMDYPTKQQKIFASALKGNQLSGLLRYTIQSPSVTRESFAQAVSTNLLNRIQNIHETLPRSQRNTYDFMVDRSASGEFTLKTEVEIAVTRFAAAYFTKNFDALQEARAKAQQQSHGI